MQQDIVSITAGLLGADGLPAGAADGIRGYLTSGGTESLLQATKTARDWGRADRGVDRPNMVLATSAHAAFEKAAHYFDVESRRVPVRADFTADVDAMADAVDDGTVLMVGSAPSYPQGVIDPIADLAALASERGILCHVDACLGGFLLPFLETLGHVAKPWDLSVPGVTSISADLHKYGYAVQGRLGHPLPATAELARLQPFVTTDWLGGLYGSPVHGRHPSRPAPSPPAGPCSTTSARTATSDWPRTPSAAATAHQGRHRRHARTRPTGRPRRHGVRLRRRPGRRARSTPSPSATPWPDRGGWFFDRQTPPDSLHATVHAGHLAVVDELRAPTSPPWPASCVAHRGPGAGPEHHLRHGRDRPAPLAAASRRWANRHFAALPANRQWSIHARVEAGPAEPVDVVRRRCRRRT